MKPTKIFSGIPTINTFICGTSLEIIPSDMEVTNMKPIIGIPIFMAIENISEIFSVNTLTKLKSISVLDTGIEFKESTTAW